MRKAKLKSNVQLYSAASLAPLLGLKTCNIWTLKQFSLKTEPLPLKFGLGCRVWALGWGFPYELKTPALHSP